MLDYFLEDRFLFKVCEFNDRTLIGVKAFESSFHGFTSAEALQAAAVAYKEVCVLEIGEADREISGVSRTARR